MRSALVQFAPTFEPFSPKEYTSDVLADSLGWQNSRPYEARGDFNGDGAIDVALNGHDKTRELLIVILSQPDGSYKLYALKAIARQPTYNHDVQVYLTAAKPGRVEGSTGAGPDSLPHGGIVVNYMPPTSEIYYWNGSDFLQFFTGD
jgi:hypothetical protein